MFLFQIHVLEQIVSNTKKQTKQKTNFIHVSITIILSMKAPIKDNIFNSGALLSKAPIVINIFILFILFYSGQFFFSGDRTAILWSIEPRIGLALC